MAGKARSFGRTRSMFDGGVSVKRKFAPMGTNPLSETKYKAASSIITNPDGSVVFRMDDAQVPEGWSQLATDIVVSKYFRKRGVPDTNCEKSVAQVVARIVDAIRDGGEERHYFASSEDADNFAAELAHLLINQMGAFNSPVWFNCGLWHSYGIAGSGGNFAWSDEEQEIVEIENSYSRPQCSACFIQSIDDDLMSIFELAKNEAKLFKYGSGTGTNFSSLRSRYEKLSGGGTSSGLMSFLEVLDRGAGATKSGGTTRRAAKMVTLDIDHPEIMDFIEWKVKEEKKVEALVEAGYSTDFNGEAYKTVSGQNSNNSIRVSDDFMQAYLNDGSWQTKLRMGGEVHKNYRARELMNKIADATWRCADPGLQFDTTINKWHTCKESGRINASNPCSEFMFVDDSACNLASLNLMKFYDAETGEFDIELFRHAVRIFIIAQEILVDFSSYPTAHIARNSHLFRPLGLGYANLGTLLMVGGIPYDSDEGRAWAASITAVMTATAYQASAEIAEVKGPFKEYETNRESMLGVINMHRDAAYSIDEGACPSYLVTAARDNWDKALAEGAKHGYRNAQVTVLAPTGTIGLLMDCDTTGIEPDYALVKFKKLAGGGFFKIVNQSVPLALQRLGYTPDEIKKIITYAQGTSKLEGAPYVNEHTLRDKGFTEEDIARIEKVLPGSFDLRSAFSPGVLGKETMGRLGFSEEEFSKPGFNLLKEFGFSDEQIDEAADHICGRMTLEGAPHLKEGHYPVFDCANRCGKHGTRFIEPMGHIRMMSAVQPFISGAISKTINLPNETVPEDVERLYVESWKLGLKAVALYRDGSKIAQPLSTGKKVKKKKEEALVEEQGIAAADENKDEIPKPLRRRLSKKRRGQTFEARVGGNKVYLRTGEYDDGMLGELFIDMHKEGAAFRSMMNCFAIAVSLGLQYGVPLEEYVDCFTFTRFEPQGVCDHPNIKMATSVVDFIFRLLGMEYLGRTDFVQVKPTKDDDFKMELMSPTAKERMEEKFKDQGGEGGIAVKETTSGVVAVPIKPKAEAKREGSNKVNIVIKHKKKKSASVSAGGVSYEMSSLNAHMSSMMGDAPFCDQCGHVTVRNGACYRCTNCGNSMGCS